MTRFDISYTYMDKNGILFTDGREVIDKWKQHSDEYLNSDENEGTGDQGNGENDFICTAEEGDDPILLLTS